MLQHKFDLNLRLASVLGSVGVSGSRRDRIPYVDGNCGSGRSIEQNDKEDDFSFQI